MKLANLKLNPDNPRNIKPEKLEKLAQSIKDFPKMMVKRPIVYDENKVIIGGNMRYRAIQKLGMDEIPDEWTSDASDFTPEERKRFIMQDNAEMGEHDWDMVANQYELEDLDAWGIDVPYADTTEEVQEDEPPEVGGGAAVSVLGTVYQLGRHRVMCGDSTDKDAISELTQGSKPDLIYTDPPYGMFLDADYSDMKPSAEFIEQKGFKAGKKYDNVIGDHADFDPAFITTIFEMYPMTKEVFLWGADYYTDLLPERNAGSWIVWDKRVTESFDKMYGSAFELCWSKNKHRREIARITWANVFGTEQEFDHKRHHPTQKPIGLSRWFIEKYSETGDSVLDLFLGSGSTLIACEQTDRTCYGMELDEKYLDVIRKRWAKYVYPDRWEKEWEILTPAIEKL